MLGRRTDVLAANPMARLLLANFDAMPARHRNAVRWLVLDEGAKSIWGDKWAKTGQARLRDRRRPRHARRTGRRAERDTGHAYGLISQMRAVPAASPAAVHV
uniref:MmyB family transcriptional regulator n=1 Tax=Paractinoplanes polyasparticus TaxID=2856853 RepID=UPI0027DF017D|nr:hypothetical protein [Actinoplanes polyasparticus]